MAFVAYLWPPVLTANKAARLNVCLSTLSPNTSVQVFLHEGAHLILESRVVLPEAGYNILCFNFAPFSPVEGGPCLQLSLLSTEGNPDSSLLRQPTRVPILILPAESAAEILSFFDNKVQVAVAHLRLNHPDHPASSSTAPSPADAQNRTVRRVYRRAVLPMVLQMHAILQDVPYHDLRDICTRLAPVLHAAQMSNCLSMFRNVIRRFNDVRGDPLAAPAPLPPLHTASMTRGPNQRVNDFWTLSSTVSASNQGRAQPTSTLASTSASSNRPDESDSSDLGDMCALLDLPPQPAPPARGRATPAAASSLMTSAFLHLSQDADSFDGSDTTGNMSSSATPAAAMPELGRSLSRIHETDELSDEFSESLMLTSFLPAQDDHLQDSPLHMLIDPDQPASYPASRALSTVGSIVAAAHSNRPSSVYALHSAGNSSASSMQNQANDPEVTVGMLGFNPPLYWSAVVTDAEAAMRQYDPSSLLSTRQSLRSAGSDPSALEVEPVVGGGGAPEAAVEHVTMRSRGGGDSGCCALGTGGSGEDCTPVSGSVSQKSSSLQCFQSSERSSDTQDSQNLTQLLQSSWHGFLDPTLESRFRMHWAFSCWLVDALAFGITAAIVSAQVPAAAGVQLVVLLTLPLLCAHLLLLLTQGQKSAVYREQLTVLTRLTVSVASLFILHKHVKLELDLLHAATATMPGRLALAHLENICRPVLVRSALWPLLIEALTLSTLTYGRRWDKRLAELLITWGTTLVVTLAMDVGARKAFGTMHLQARSNRV